MTNFKTVRINCTECGEEVVFDLYKSVNVTSNPELRSKVLDNSLFRAECFNCEHSEIINLPFTYHDNEHNFVVRLDSYADLLELKEEIREGSIEKRKYIELGQNTKVVGVTSIADLKTAVVALENGLDWRIVGLVISLLESDFKDYFKKENQKTIEITGSGLEYSNCYDGELRVYVNDDTNTHHSTPFPIDMYNFCLEKEKKRLDTINPFVFGINEMKRFVLMKEKYINKYEKKKDKYYYVREPSGYCAICSAHSFLQNKIGVGSLVLVDLIGGRVTEGIIKRIVYWNPLFITSNILGFGQIVSQKTNCHFITTESVDNVIDQEDTMRELLDYKKQRTKSGNLPTKLLTNTNMIVCYQDISDLDLNKGIDQFELSDLVKKDPATGFCVTMFSLEKIYTDYKKYLVVYTDLSHVKDKRKHTCCASFDFDTIVKIIKEDPRYDGIIINPNDNNIVIDTWEIKKYIKSIVTSDEDEWKRLLNDLDSDEKKFVGELAYDCMTSIFNEGLSRQAVSVKYHIDEKKLKKIFIHGYKAMEEIAFARF